MRTRKRIYRIVLWAAAGLILLLSARELMASPTRPAEAEGAVVISEFLADNRSRLLVDENGDAPDWIELHNRTGRAVNLAGWALTDDPAIPTKWVFDAVQLKPDAYLLVFASAKDRRRIEVDEESGQPGYLHTNFKLPGEGGFLALYPPTSRRYLDASETIYATQLPDVSMGLLDGTPTNGERYAFFAQPTPGKPNPATSTWPGMTEPVRFSRPHGIVDEPFDLELTTSTPDATIRYTTDGSEPSAEHGEVYTKAIRLQRTTPVRAAAFIEGYRSAPPVTQSYIFIADVLTQPENPPGYPPNWGTHQIDFGGYAAGSAVVADYAMDPEVIADPIYGPQLPAALRALPVMSIAGAVDEVMGIYASPHERGRLSERPASVELFYADGSREGFQLNAGLRIHGAAGRWEFMPKKSFRLFFRQEYGTPKLRYRVFDDSPVEVFDTLILRAGTDRGFAGHPTAPDKPIDQRDAEYARDEFTRRSQIAMSGFGVHGTYVHLLINGLYWGIYNLVERPDAEFMASYLGGQASEWGVISHGGTVDLPGDRFNTLVQLAREGNADDPQRYKTLLEFVDPVQLSDYLILNWYVGNRDWPENNWFVGAHYPAGTNFVLTWDAEVTLDHGAQIVMGGAGFEGAPFPNIIKEIFEALWQNPDFRLLFADRLYQHVGPGGALSDEASRARYRAIVDAIEPAIVAESARWGDTRFEPPLTPATWRLARDNVLAQFEGNGARLVQLAREAGYFPLIDAPQVSPPAGPNDGDVVVALSAAGGEIFYTVDGSDPRQAATGAVAVQARRYTEPVVLAPPLTVKTRVRAGDNWSALRTAEWHYPDQESDVRITEIMYNPEGGEQYAYLEITNLGELPADLSNAYVTGVDYHFPLYTTLQPGQRMVLVADFKAFRRRYAEAAIQGIFQRKLSDRGETISLRTSAGAILDAVTYSDEDGWPLSADGVGDSLVLINPAGDPNAPYNWRASTNPNGSPGTDER